MTQPSLAALSRELEDRRRQAEALKGKVDHLTLMVRDEEGKVERVEIHKDWKGQLGPMVAARIHARLGVLESSIKALVREWE